MSLKGLIIAFVLLPVFGLAQKKSIDYYVKKAPFDMPQVAEPVIPKRDFDITQFGAVGDGKQLNTEPFASAIATCTEAGGGRIIIPRGTWLTGPIEIKSNLEIHVEEGATVLFTPDKSQYPIREYSKGKFDVTPPIWGDKLENVAFTGNGTFDGSGYAWRPVKRFKVSKQQWEELIASGGVLSGDGKVWWPSKEAIDGADYLKSLSKKKTVTAEDYTAARDFLRPKLFTLSKVKNLLIDGPTFRDSPHFMINPKQITNLIIRNVTVYNPGWAQNGDGIDISASKNVIIYNCKVNAGDDGICMKSSGDVKDADEAKLENIIIAECTVNEGHGGFVIGSNTDGGMRNIYVSNCVFDGTDIGVRVKSNTGRGGNVHQIFIEDIYMPNILETAILFDTYYEDVPVGSTQKQASAQHTGEKTPHFFDIHFSNIKCDRAKTAMFFRGLPEQKIHDIYFKDVQIDAEEGVQGESVENIHFENVSIKSKKQPTIDANLKSAIVFK